MVVLYSNFNPEVYLFLGTYSRVLDCQEHQALILFPDFEIEI